MQSSEAIGHLNTLLIQLTSKDDKNISNSPVNSHRVVLLGVVIVVVIAVIVIVVPACCKYCKRHIELLPSSTHSRPFLLIL